MSNIEEEKLIIFGWIVTMIGLPADVKQLRKYNDLSDKFHEIMQFRATEPLQQPQNTERDNVQLLPQKPSERLYEAHRESIKDILAHHGVLTRDGWSMETDALVDDLIKLETKENKNDTTDTPT